MERRQNLTQPHNKAPRLFFPYIHYLFHPFAHMPNLLNRSLFRRYLI
uniref:Uncharacterized protein n=1 Tax=Anguilla anguilla TaxID=7936 RepID=A0A0E9SYJ1_ANGAN